MTNVQKQQSQQNGLHSTLWSIANDLRGNMDASEFKNYILGLIFYRYLSENLLDYVNNVLLKEDNLTYHQAWANKEYQQPLKDDLLEDSKVGYYIEPENLYSTLIQKINTGTFNVTLLAKAVNALSDSTLNSESKDDFANLFDDMDLNSTRLGKSESERTKLISKVMLKINDIDFHIHDSEIDILGDAYEYLIGQFAASAGKKAGEFYTPQQVSAILAKLVTLDKSSLKSVYDPTCGSGSLLLRIGKEAKVARYFGQELNSTTYNIARMNMLLHGISFRNFDIKNDNTLVHPQHLDLKFEAIVANPPYGSSWSSDESFMDDPRFNRYGRLAPKSKADYAFIQHMIYQLDDYGTMAVVLPHGVLFRGGAEGVIREYLIKEKNYLDAVIGLPANIFFGTSIPTCILVFKKCREVSEGIMFIDASNEYESGKNQNRLTDENVEKIVSVYKEKQDFEKYARLVALDEVKENEYNLNIPRYINTFDEYETADLESIQKDIQSINKEIIELEEEVNRYLKELGIYYE